MPVRRTLPALAVLGLVASLGVAAEEPPACHVALERDTATTEDDLVACTTPTYLTDNSGVKAGNTTAADEAPSAVLSLEAPTESVTAGAGAGFLGTSLAQLAEPNEYATGLTIGGEIDGPVDSLDVTLHGFHNGYGSLPISPTDPTGSDPDPTNPANRNGATFYVDLLVDGATLASNVELEALTAPAESANAANSFRFRITGIASVFEGSSLEMTGEGTHTLELRVTPRYINTDPAVLFVYGTTEVPSSIVVNTDPSAETPEGLPSIDL